MLQFIETAHPIFILAVIMAYMAFGDFLTKKTRAFLPSVFIMVLLMAGSVWLGLIPADIVRRVGFAPPLTAVATVLLVANMGTSLKLKDITSNGRIVVLGLVSLAGVALGCLTLGRWLFGWYHAVIATPVVGGGIVAMLEMQSAAADIGGERGQLLASLAAMILAVQSLPAFLIIPPILKRAMAKDLAATDPEIIAAGGEETPGAAEAEAKGTYLPDKYWSPATILCALGLVGTIGWLVNRWMTGLVGHFAVSIQIVTLLLAIALTELRILPRNAAVKAGINGFVLLIVIFNAFSAVLAIDLPQFLSLLGPVAGMIAAGILGILVVTYLLARFVLKMDPGFAFVLGLNCLLGFPINLVLTQESIGSLANGNPEVERYLTNKYVPPMLVAGFVTITIGSVFLAGIMRSLL